MDAVEMWRFCSDSVLAGAGGTAPAQSYGSSSLNGGTLRDTRRSLDLYFRVILQELENMQSDTMDEPLLGPEDDHAASAATSYHGRASELSTGALFPDGTRGIVDRLPCPSRPCLLLADHDPLAQVTHTCLLEKEAAGAGGEGRGPAFSVVHVCAPLAGRGDAGTRILRKIGKGAGLGPPVLIHGGNIMQEGGGGGGASRWTSLTDCLLPEYIDGAIGEPHLLTPGDAVAAYNMRQFIKSHARLPRLFHEVLADPSPARRMGSSRELLGLLKRIDSDLLRFEGPYLCGEEYTLADIYVFPVIERVHHVLSAYRSFWIPPSLTRLMSWYETVSRRPAVRKATSDRSAESMETYCYESKSRREYLVEVYECHARHEADLFLELNAERGRAGVNVYRDAVEEDLRDRRVREQTNNCQKCVLM